MVLFLIEISVSPKEEKEIEVKSIFSSENYVKETRKEENVNSMLAKLDEETAGEEDEEEVKEEVVEETAQEETEEVVEDAAQETTEEAVEEVAQEAQVEEVAKSEENNEEDDEEDDETSDAGEDAEILEYTGLKEEAVEVSGSIDYSARLEKIIASRDKIDRDLAKIQKAILKYERTKRRKNRNQKMLDRRAGELTNLNLVMYSVTDIKNVDEDKKAKQEELTAHIAELKASIQDAEEYIDSNKEKNDHNVKMAKFLLQEKARYNEEIAELQKLVDEAK